VAFCLKLSLIDKKKQFVVNICLALIDSITKNLAELHIVAPKHLSLSEAVFLQFYDSDEWQCTLAE